MVLRIYVLTNIRVDSLEIDHSVEKGNYVIECQMQITNARSYDATTDYCGTQYFQDEVTFEAEYQNERNDSDECVEKIKVHQQTKDPAVALIFDQLNLTCLNIPSVWH
jgi:hypothetical protein